MAKRKKPVGRTPRYKDIESFIDPRNLGDFDKFIDKIGEFEDALDGAARKSVDMKKHVSEAASEYKDSLDSLGSLGKKIVKLFSVQSDMADDLTNRINGFSKASFDSINPAVKNDILDRIKAIKGLTDGVEAFGLKSTMGLGFLRDYTGQIGGDIANWVTNGGEFIGKLKKMGLIMAPIALFAGAIVGAFKIVTGIFTKALDRLLEIEDASISIRKEFGLSANAAKEFTGYINANREKFLALGISSEVLAGNINEAQKEFGFIRDITSTELSLINQLNARLGITASTTAGVLKLFNLIGKETRQSDANMLLSTLALSEAGRVANAEVFEDIKDNSEQILLFFRGTDAELSQAVIKARQLGLSISSVTGFASQLLDFESSIASELNASVLLGRQINLDVARRLAFEGDLVGLQEEMLRITKSAGDFDKMNMFQKKAISDALGLSVMEMRNMLVLEEKLSKLTDGDKAKFAQLSKAQKAELEGQQKITSLDIDRVKNIGDMQNTMDRLKNSFGAIIGNIVKTAQPAIATVLKHVQQLTSAWGDAFNDPDTRRGLVESFQKISYSVTQLLDKLFKPENLQKIASVVETIIAGAIGVVDWVMNMFGGGRSNSSVSSMIKSSQTPSVSSMTKSSQTPSVKSTANANILSKTGMPTQITSQTASLDNASRDANTKAINELVAMLGKPLGVNIDGRKMNSHMAGMGEFAS